MWVVVVVVVVVVAFLLLRPILPHFINEGLFPNPIDMEGNSFHWLFWLVLHFDLAVGFLHCFDHGQFAQ